MTRSPVIAPFARPSHETRFATWFATRLARIARGASFLVLAVGSLAACLDDEPDHPHSENFVLGDGDSYQKNPDVVTAREYWIVTRSEGGSYAMLPRPDGDPRIVEECTTGGPLASLFDGAELCRPANETTLGRVNNLTEAEALQTSTFLHAKLRFTAHAAEYDLASAYVEPYPMTDDLLDVCKTYPADRHGTLQSICDEEFEYENASARPAIARRYSLEECQVMAARLNELYGIR